MKIAIWLVALLLPMSAAAEIVEEVDRFTGTKTIRTPFVVPDGDLAVQFVWIATESKPPEWAVMLAGLFEGGWRYLRCDHTVWLADGERVLMPATTNKGSSGTGGVTELLFLFQPELSSLRALADASLVEYRVCTDERSLTPTEHGHLRKWLSAVEAQIAE